MKIFSFDLTFCDLKIHKRINYISSFTDANTAFSSLTPDLLRLTSDSHVLPLSPHVCFCHASSCVYETVHVTSISFQFPHKDMQAGTTKNKQQASQILWKRCLLTAPFRRNLYSCLLEFWHCLLAKVKACASDFLSLDKKNKTAALSKNIWTIRIKACVACVTTVNIVTTAKTL